MIVRCYLWFHLFALLLLCNFAKAQTIAGPLNPGSVTTGSCSFSYSSVLGYAPTISVISSNNISASAVHCPCCDAHTNCLRATNFGFTIPLGAVITGITVEIEKRADAGSSVQDNGLRLLQGGVEVGSNLANFGLNWPSFDTYYTYGGCNNLWGASWTASDINSPNFGFVFASIDYSCLGNISSFIDHVRVTVCYNLVLPIELASFEGERKSGSDHLRWSTVQETLSDYFLVERSFDAHLFEPLARISSKNNSNGSSYSFENSNITSEISYYRLRFVDKDKSFGFSNTIALSGASSKLNVEIFPNPAGDEFTLQMSTADPQNTMVKLFNSYGQEVLYHLVPAGISKQAINTAHLNEGVYLVQVSNESEQISNKKILIQHIGK